jgi:hypothetical protein
MKKMRRSLPPCRTFEGGVQPSGAVIFLLVFGQPVATRRRTRLEGVLAVLGEIRGGGPVWDVESGGTVCVLVADCQRPQSRARLTPETMTVTVEEFSPTHDFFDYTASPWSALQSKGTGMPCKLPAKGIISLPVYSTTPRIHRLPAALASARKP